MNKIQGFFSRLFYGRNGWDELNKFIFAIDIVLYILAMVLKNGFIYYLSVFGCFYLLYRMFSKRLWDREAENRKYLSYVKLWKLKYEQRKTCKIFMCKSCGRYVRVPKKKGRIQVTCPVCGNKSTHRT